MLAVVLLVAFVSDIAIFVLKRDVKLQLTNYWWPASYSSEYRVSDSLQAHEAAWIVTTTTTTCTTTTTTTNVKT